MPFCTEMPSLYHFCFFLRFLFSSYIMEGACSCLLLLCCFFLQLAPSRLSSGWAVTPSIPSPYPCTPFSPSPPEGIPHILAALALPHERTRQIKQNKCITEAQVECPVGIFSFHHLSHFLSSLYHFLFFFLFPVFFFPHVLYTRKPILHYISEALSDINSQSLSFSSMSFHLNLFLFCFLFLPLPVTRTA